MRSQFIFTPVCAPASPVERLSLLTWPDGDAPVRGAEPGVAEETGGVRAGRFRPRHPAAHGRTGQENRPKSGSSEQSAQISGKS